jgi:hypothetical protein
MAQRFAAHHDRTTLYHETITWAYAALIHERMQRTPTASWDDFCRENADLLSWRPSILDRYYHSETLNSVLARRVFHSPRPRTALILHTFSRLYEFTPNPRR